MGKDALPFLPTASCHAAPDNAPALNDDTRAAWMSYGELRAAIRALAPLLTLPQRDLVMVCAPRSVEGAVAYLAAAESGHAIAMADPTSPRLEPVAQTYQPAWILAPRDIVFEGYAPVPAPLQTLHLLRRQSLAEGPLHPDFYLLLLTSGSTGSPKGVRLSYRNMASNTAAIIESLDLTGDEIACGHLPLSYSFGLSVLHMQLTCGGRISLTEESLMSGTLWKRQAAHGATLFPGVPYHFEMLMRLGLDRLKIPSLSCFLQAGGKMPIPLTQRVLEASNKRQGRLYIMYGQTEAAPRMTCFPLHAHPEKMGSSGRALSGGSITIEADEIVYHGPNVMMGPALSRADLALGDVMNGRLATGDLGTLDAEGYLTITGRRQRFAKLFGQRVALDDLERIAARHAFCAALEHPEKAVLFTAQASPDLCETIRQTLAAETKLPVPWIEVRSLDALPLKQNGKIDYQALQKLVNEQ